MLALQALPMPVPDASLRDFSLPVSADLLTQLRAGALMGTTRLDLCADLTSLPEEIESLADSLEVLNVSGNQLTSLPDWLPALKKLRILFCSHNPFGSLPEVLGACSSLDLIGFRCCAIRHVPGSALPPQIRGLILTDNRLEDLPEEIGDCRALTKLMLSGNRLGHLPESLAECRNLELLRLAANEFHSFPEWLWDLPALAWLAVAGNPCTTPWEMDLLSEARIPWQELSLGPILGEGASGRIYRAAWHGAPDDCAREVAVKLFKGAMTSDGLPASEMAACLAAGGHPQLIGALGKLQDHPDGIPGLVMPLMDPVSLPLAGPPSLESCTRDIYPDGPGLDAPSAVRLLRDIAAAALHLHEQGFLHGDLYAHNILHNAGGAAVLGDFGAASLHPPAPAGRVSRIEARAFGVLVQETILHCTEPNRLPQALHDLAARCLQPNVDERPDFRQIWASVSE